ncbi:Regulator of sirC expression [Cyclonatronum proteinivorum]|uniref:Regulator of sirC expression n=1 Tax=Cyclonatronum proteinivorum TaxID=1457365 RepID=A0A345UGD0_9BACT|nr:Regulator of sirC expression [Cyclonatronum proteinivorum]
MFPLLLTLICDADDVYPNSISRSVLNAQDTLQREIKALIQLFDDPAPEIRDTVTKRLVQMGEAVVPQLDRFMADTKDEALKKEAEAVIRSVTFDSLQEEVAELAAQGVHTMEELEDAVFLFSRFKNPTLRIRPYRELLDALAQEASVPLRRADTAESRMLAFTHFIFEQNGYKGCSSKFLHPEHSYMHEVLRKRQGIPLSLAFVMLFVAERLKLPFYGMNMPLHFLVKFITPANESIIIDPFNQGSILTKEQCDLFLKNSRIRIFPQYYETASPYSMLTRFIRNLINGHMEAGEPELSKQLQHLLLLVESANTDRAK